MKITGLVRSFNLVRARLQAGLAPHEIEPFKKNVLSLVRQVEDICRRHNSSPQHLPGPSRMAYQFLRDLDLNHLPGRSADEPAPPKPGFKIKNLVATGEYFADQFQTHLRSLQTSAPERDKLRAEIEEQATLIEQISAKHGQTPAALEGPSRQMYCWFRFLSNPDNLTLHLDALARAQWALGAYQGNLPVHLHLTFLNALWRRRDYQNVTLVRINEGFLHADQSVWQAIIENSAIRTTKDNDILVRDYAASEDFSEVIFELESFTAGVATSSRGRIHNLEESFARVNAAYFNNQMPRPVLTWNRALTANKFGHYQASRDTVMLSVTLDDTRAPAFVLDFVMYHELLHKKHGIMTVNGRRIAHSPAFRADEQKFTSHRKAEQILHDLASQQRGLPGRKTMQDED